MRERFDVVVVGSGAGGGVVAGELADRGRRVLLLEVGPHKTAADFTRWEAKAPSIPFSIRSAASFQPRCRNISSPERIIEPGFTRSWSAYRGAVPWVASKMAWPVR